MMINYFENVVEDFLGRKFIGTIGNVRIIVWDAHVRDYTRGGLSGFGLIESDFEDCDNPTPVPTIYLDNFAYENEDVREFVVFHEYGHIINDHNSKINELFGGGMNYAHERSKGLNDVIMKLEYEADDLAIENIGAEKSLYSLNKLHEYIKEEFKEFTSQETEVRLERLKRMC